LGKAAGLRRVIRPPTLRLGGRREIDEGSVCGAEVAGAQAGMLVPPRKS
jgi:hypothetical protein